MSYSISLVPPAMTILQSHYSRRNIKRSATSHSSRFLSTSTPPLRQQYHFSRQRHKALAIPFSPPRTTIRNYWPPWKSYIKPPPPSKTTPRLPLQYSRNLRNGIILASCIALTLGLAALSASQLHKMSSSPKSSPPESLFFEIDPEHTRAIFSNKRFTSFKEWEPTKGEYTIAYGSRVELEAAGHRCVMPQLAFWWYMPYLPQVWVVVW